MNDPKAQNPLPTTVQVSDLRKILQFWDEKLADLESDRVAALRKGAVLQVKIIELGMKGIRACRADIAALLPPQGLS